jgi:hypothetical protein
MESCDALSVPLRSSTATSAAKGNKGMTMTIKREAAEATTLYAAAHAEQYTRKDLRAALKLYIRIIDDHAVTPEAEFCRAQIKHIVDSAVPKQELFDTQVALAEKYLGFA